jgi:hypothetical protein
MSRRLRCSLAVLLALAVAAAVAIPADAHKGNPNYRSRVTSPQQYGGLFVRVVRYDDSLEVLNRSGTELIVKGYRGEPYLRFDETNVVHVNEHSPTTYLNQDRYGQGVNVPASATPQAKPLWRTVSRTGRYAWHDHRIHWMGTGLPPQVKDQGVRTTVFDWKIPFVFGGIPGRFDGTLIWVGNGTSAGSSNALAIALVAILASVLAVVVLGLWRRRRARVADVGPEAW